MAYGAVAARLVLEGRHELGYQDAGSATLLSRRLRTCRKAAWLYLQFIVSKSVSLKKSHVGLTFIANPHLGQILY